MGEKDLQKLWGKIFAKIMGEITLQNLWGKNTEQDNLKHFHYLYF